MFFANISFHHSCRYTSNRDVNQNPYFSQVSDAGVPCCVAAAAGCLEWKKKKKNGEVTGKTKENYRRFDWKSMKHLDLNRFNHQKRGCHQPKFGFHQPKMGKLMKVPHLETEKWSSKEEFRIMLFSFTASSGFKSSGEKSTQKQLSADYMAVPFWHRSSKRVFQLFKSFQVTVGLGLFKINQAVVSSSLRDRISCATKAGDRNLVMAMLFFKVWQSIWRDQVKQHDRSRAIFI